MFNQIPFQDPVMFKNAFLSSPTAVGSYTPSAECINLKPKAGSYEEDPRKRTTDPIVTGTSVLAIKYDGGVMMAADTLASYGSLARYRNVQRIQTISNNTLIGAGGEYSDFQELMMTLDDLVRQDENANDGHHLQPKEFFSYLTRVMYNRRNKFDPLFNQLVVAGVSKVRDPTTPNSYTNQVFLGTVDYNGTYFEDNTIATGYGAYIARPLLRKVYKPKMTEKEARDVLEDCMRVMYYRDARALNKVQFAKVAVRKTEEAGSGELVLDIAAPVELKTEWRHTERALGYPKPTDENDSSG